MSGITIEQRAMMAAHIAERAAVALRSGHDRGGLLLLKLTRRVQHQSLLRSEDYYRSALEIDGLSALDINASVSAILRGEHPPDSLAGKVAMMRDEAAEAQLSAADDTRFQWLHGRRKALDAVLVLLGAKP